VRIKIEDLLISRGQVIKHNLKKKQAEREAELEEEFNKLGCTFSPRINTQKSPLIK
jgi:hypothetical protein